MIDCTRIEPVWDGRSLLDARIASTRVRGGCAHAQAERCCMAGARRHRPACWLALSNASAGPALPPLLDGATRAALAGRLAAEERFAASPGRRARGDRIPRGGAHARHRGLASTEWSLHPRGALAQGLERRPASDGAPPARAARLPARARGPCEGYRVALLDA